MGKGGGFGGRGGPRGGMPGGGRFGAGRIPGPQVQANLNNHANMLNPNSSGAGGMTGGLEGGCGLQGPPPVFQSEEERYYYELMVNDYDD